MIKTVKPKLFKIISGIIKKKKMLKIFRKGYTAIGKAR